MQIKYSVIVPVYNESYSIPLLWRHLKTVMGDLKEPYEVIFINDGSDTKTHNLLNDMKAKHDNIAVYHLKENMGQTEALRKGFEIARGDIIVSMDADLQDDPKYIPQFINKINEGYDVVCGYRRRRKDKLNKIILSKIGNFIQGIVWKTGLHDLACTYRAYRKGCIKDINLSRRGYHRYIPYFLSRQGCRITELEIEQNKRPYLESKYSFLKMFDVIYEFLSICFVVSKDKEKK